MDGGCVLSARHGKCINCQLWLWKQKSQSISFLNWKVRYWAVQYIGVSSPLTKVLLSIQYFVKTICPTDADRCWGYCCDTVSSVVSVSDPLLGSSCDALSLSLSVQTVHSVSAHPAAAARERPAEHLLIKVAHVIMAPPLCRVPPRWEEDRLCHQEIWASWLSWSWTTYMNKVFVT